MLQSLKKVVEKELDSGKSFNPQLFKGPHDLADRRRPESF